jgi:hypothetical protein
MKDITFFPFFHRDDPRLSSATLMGALHGTGSAASPRAQHRRARPVPKRNPAKRAARKRKQASKRANR